VGDGQEAFRAFEPPCTDIGGSTDRTDMNRYSMINTLNERDGDSYIRANIR